MTESELDAGQRLEATLVEAHLRQHRYILPVSAMISTLLLAVLYQAYPSPLPITLWWLAVLALSLWRVQSVRRWQRAAAPLAAALAMRQRLIVEATLAGLLWGLVGSVLCPPADSGLSAVAAIALMGVGASGLVSLSPLMPAYLGFFAAMLIPSVVGFALRETYLEHLFSLTLAIFMVSLYLNGRRIEHNLRSTLGLQAKLEDSLRRADLSRREADAANRAKSMFLATMSHEIRTPMNGVLGMAQSLAASELSPRQRGQLDSLQESGRHLLRLIDEVLDLSRIEAGRLELVEAPCAPGALVVQLVELLEPRARERGLVLAHQVHPRTPAYMLGDALRLRQIVANLISNAIKYCPAGRIDVTVERRPAWRGESLQISVRDTGPGVAEADRERIFETFRQLDGSSSRKEGGVGLGLSISRQLAGLMGGELVLDPTPPGGGASFTLSLPLVECPPPEPEAPFEASAGHDPASRCILIVEDNATNRLVAANALEQLGYGFDEATDGLEALACLQQRSYAAVLMDCQMPGMDGLEATRRWRAIEAGDGRPRTPIIALTANAVVGDADDCLAAGMDAYLSKPFQFERLAALLQAQITAPAADDPA